MFRWWCILLGVLSDAAPLDHAAPDGLVARRPESRPVNEAGGDRVDEVGGESLRLPSRDSAVPSGAQQGGFFPGSSNR